MTGTSSPKLCFVIMPFSKERKEVYKFGIAPACQQAGYEAKRVDELVGHFNINRKIIEYLFRCDAVVAEITDKNPNVFYEMGVAHAIANKTIMIAQDADKLPFDIRNYRCIIYEQSVEGLQRLQEEIVRSLQEIGDWSRHPSNPVQDFKPYDAFVLQSDFSKLQKTLRQKEELLAAAQMEAASVQKQLREKDANLEQASKGTTAELQDRFLRLAADFANYKRRSENELAQKQAEMAALQKEMQLLRQLSAPPSLKKMLRSQPLDEFFGEQVKKMFKEKNFFDSNYNKNGRGLRHQYEKIVHADGTLVMDQATGLMWQQSGSSNEMNYADAEKYVRDLNAKEFGGYNDWRLPTLEEAMSLMEPEKKNGNLYIEPVFDETQRNIWTADKSGGGSVAWVVGFYHGYCHSHRVDNYVSYVRVVH